jgi:peptide/nickel transport system permease protein
MSAPPDSAGLASAWPAGAGRLGPLARSLGQVPLIPGVVLAIVILTAVFADVFALHSPTATDLQQTFRPPAWVAGGSWRYPLGTDNLGRDIYTRTIYGSRISLIVGFVVVFIGGSVGTALALVAGYVGRWVDALIMRVTDAFFAMPFLVVAIVLAAILGPSLVNLIVVLAAVGWTRYARVIRSEVLRLKEMDFVAAATLSGTRTPLILWRHILPNIVNTLLVLATLELGSTIIAAAALGFLGLGLPSTVPAWGSMLADGRPYIASAWWIALFPGLAIAVTVLGTNLFGDWLRWRLDPRYRQL